MDGPIPWENCSLPRSPNAKPRERDYKLADGAGLYLLVKSNGRKLWRLNYAHLGKQRTLSFGAWPDVGLADARSQRDDARRMIATGLDPSHEKKLATAREMIARGEQLQGRCRGVAREERARGHGRCHARQDPLAARQGLSQARQPTDRQDHRAGSAGGAADDRGDRSLRKRAADAQRAQPGVPLCDRDDTRGDRSRARPSRRADRAEGQASRRDPPPRKALAN